MVARWLVSSSDIAERTVATLAQSALAVLAASCIEPLGVPFSWTLLLVCAFGAAGLSLVKSSVASQFGTRSGSLFTPLNRDPATGRFTSRRITYSEEETSQGRSDNGD
jgi:hypothetical protein